MKNVLYLHGLEGNAFGPKTEFLKTEFNQITPDIDYRKDNIFLEILKIAIDLSPDFIIGSSMGGYFAKLIGEAINVPVLLFNPALSNRSFEPDVTGSDKRFTNIKTRYILGAKDDVIDPNITIKGIKGKTSDVRIWKENGHRTPYDTFVKEVQDFSKSI